MTIATNVEKSVNLKTFMIGGKDHRKNRTNSFYKIYLTISIADLHFSCLLGISNISKLVGDIAFTMIVAIIFTEKLSNKLFFSLKLLLFLDISEEKNIKLRIELI